MVRHFRATLWVALINALVPAGAWANDYIPDSGVLRSEAAGTWLPDGTLLIAGGNSSNQSSQIYDPFTNQWTDAGRMASGHSAFELGRLRDGGVVIGDADGGFEFYSLDAKAWVPMGPWGSNRSKGSGVETRQGVIVFVGGSDAGGSPVPQIEELSPDGGWSPVGLLQLHSGKRWPSSWQAEISSCSEDRTLVASPPPTCAECLGSMEATRRLRRPR